MQADISSLQAQAKFLHESCQLEEALSLYEHLYSSAKSSNTLTSDLLDDYADLLTSLGNLPLARKLYKESILRFPSDNPSKYFSSAQLHSGHEAQRLYEQGLCLCGPSDKSEAAAAWAALAELYMTDLW
jgi:tetratricopeptide (TPR) repeat protein